MDKENISDQLEATIVGVVQFAERLARTLVALVFTPGRLLAEVRNGFQDKQYLTPYAFLLSCAIALGFFGKILAAGIHRVGFDTLESIKDLTFSSFLNHSAPVFGIAISAALLVEGILRKQQAEQKQHIKYLNFYVIGFFGIGSILVLLLLSGLMTLTFDRFGPGTDIFVYSSIITLSAYILAVLGLIYWLTSNALRDAGNSALPRSVSARILVINLVVIALCALNFVSPLFEHDQGTRPLKGRIVDLAKPPDDTLRLTFLLENTTDTDVVVNLIDNVTVVFEPKPGIRVSSESRYCSYQDNGPLSDVFLLLASGKSDILTVCIQGKQLHKHLKEADFVTIGREQGGYRLISLDEHRSQFSVIISVVVDDLRKHFLTVAL